LPTLEQVAVDPQTVWCAQGIPYWYGEARRTIEIVSGTAVRYELRCQPIFHVSCFNRLNLET
jgi:hypothetical protein